LSCSDRQQTEDGTGTLFDIQAALLAKHAQHVVLMHFPSRCLLPGGV